MIVSVWLCADRRVVVCVVCVRGLSEVDDRPLVLSTVHLFCFAELIDIKACAVQGYFVSRRCC